jgi:hypothetical protein
VILKTKTMQIVEYRLGEPIELYLRRRYIDEGETLATIAADLGLVAPTLSRWLAALGIEARISGQRGKTAVEAVA